MIRNLLFASALLLPIASAVPAFAEDDHGCTGAPQASWLTEDAARAKAIEAGYDVRDVKTEGSCYEIYALKGGKRVEALMDPSNGAIVRFEEGEE